MVRTDILEIAARNPEMGLQKILENIYENLEKKPLKGKPGENELSKSRGDRQSPKKISQNLEFLCFKILYWIKYMGLKFS